MVTLIVLCSILSVIVLFAYFVAKRAKKIKVAFDGAAFWLSGFILVAIFVMIGFMWGLLTSK